MNVSRIQKGLDLEFIKGSAIVVASEMTQEEGDVSCTRNPRNDNTKGWVGEKEENSMKEDEKEVSERW